MTVFRFAETVGSVTELREKEAMYKRICDVVLDPVGMEETPSPRVLEGAIKEPHASFVRPVFREKKTGKSSKEKEPEGEEQTPEGPSTRRPARKRRQGSQPTPPQEGHAGGSSSGERVPSEFPPVTGMSVDASILEDQEAACNWAHSVVPPSDASVVNAMAPRDLLRAASAHAAQALVFQSGVDRLCRDERRISLQLRKELKERRREAAAAVAAQKDLEARLQQSEGEKGEMRREKVESEKRSADALKKVVAQVGRLEIEVKEGKKLIAEHEGTIAQQAADMKGAVDFGFDECKRAVQLLLAPSIPGGLPDSFKSWNLAMPPLARGRPRGNRGGTPGGSSHGASGV